MKILKIRSGSWIIIGLIVLLFLGSYRARLWIAGKEKSQLASKKKELKTTEVPHRLVALSPSNVECLFKMGLGSHVVGISRYTKYPPEALRLPKIAGFVDVDFERVIALNPDCIIMVNSQRSLIKRFNDLGIQTLSVDHASVEGIIASFMKIAKVCGNQKQAEVIVKNMREHIAEVKKRVSGRKKPRVLVCIDRDKDSKEPIRVIAAGTKGFHQELIEIAGGKNAYQGNIAFPKLSREKLIALDPDVIIDLVRDDQIKKYSKDELFNQWAVYGELKAVKNKKIVFLVGNQHLVPGPRFIDTLDAFVAGIWGGNKECGHSARGKQGEKGESMSADRQTRTRCPHSIEGAERKGDAR